MLPQIDNQISTTTTITDIPSKTYKLNITEDDYNGYVLDNKNITLFKFENSHLYAYPQSPDCEVDFEIEDGHLIAISEDTDALDRYSIQGYNMYFDTEEFGDRIMGYVDNLEAVKQAVYHILMTERYAYLIYSENYGVELQQYIGKDFNYLEMTIERTLKEALTYDLRIKDVRVTELTKENDRANIKFVVYSIYGDLQLEVSISV